jgi:hypothetical protein
MHWNFGFQDLLLSDLSYVGGVYLEGGGGLYNPLFCGNVFVKSDTNTTLIYHGSQLISVKSGLDVCIGLKMLEFLWHQNGLAYVIS